MAPADTDRGRPETGRSAQTVGSAITMTGGNDVMTQREWPEMRQDIETREPTGQETGMGERTATAKVAENVAQTGYMIERARHSQEVSSVSVSVVI